MLKQLLQFLFSAFRTKQSLSWENIALRLSLVDDKVKNIFMWLR